MRTFKVLLVCLLIIPTLVFANEKAATVEAPISAVTVYLNGAVIQRTATVSINSERSTIVIPNISTSLQIHTLSAQLTNNAKIISIEYVNDIGKKLQDETLQNIIDSIEINKDKIEGIKNEIAAYEAERQLLNANLKLSGNNQNLNIPLLREGADFFRERSLEINNAVSALNKKKNNYITIGSKLKTKRYKIEDKKRRANAYLKLVVEARTTVNSELKISYLVTNAIWKPAYNLRVTNLDDPADFEYMARVYNNTGVDWIDIPLTFSTADPTEDANKPILAAWTLDKKSPQLLYNGRNYKNNEGILNEFKANTSFNYNLQVQSSSDKNREKLSIQQLNAQQEFDVITIPNVNVEFTTAINYTIEADAIPKNIELTTHQLMANYEYISIPKIKRGAFLIAKISNWQQYELIDGEMNIYFDDTYLGSSTINTSTLSDTLDLSLGRDNSVQVYRAKLKDQSSKKFMGINIKENLTYKIVVKNNRDEAITVDLRDQIPVSMDKAIQIEAINISNAKLDENSGTLKWLPNLGPGEEKEYIINFTVKYPKHLKFKFETKKVLMAPRYF